VADHDPQQSFSQSRFFHEHGVIITVHFLCSLIKRRMRTALKSCIELAVTLIKAVTAVSCLRSASLLSPKLALRLRMHRTRYSHLRLLVTRGLYEYNRIVDYHNTQCSRIMRSFGWLLHEGELRLAAKQLLLDCRLDPDPAIEL
jgi:hypothetical protein